MSTAPIRAIRELDKTDLLLLVDYCSEHSKLPQSRILGKFALTSGFGGLKFPKTPFARLTNR